MTSRAASAIIGVRLIALFFILLGIWLLTANVIESTSEFNPTYLGYYLVTQIVRPAVAVILGLVLWVIARPIGRLIARDLPDDQ